MPYISRLKGTGYFFFQAAVANFSIWRWSIATCIFRLKCILKWCLILSLYINKYTYIYIYIYMYTHITLGKPTIYLGAPSSPFMFFFPIQNSLKVLTHRHFFRHPRRFKDVVYRLGGQFWPSRCFMKLEGDRHGGKNVEKHGAQKRPKKQQQPRENKGLRWTLGQDYLVKVPHTKMVFLVVKNWGSGYGWFFWRTSGTNQFQISQVELLEICFFYYKWCKTWPQSDISLLQAKTRWRFQTFFIFTPIWGRFPIWLIFFKWVETTNKKNTNLPHLIEDPLCGTYSSPIHCCL